MRNNKQGSNQMSDHRIPKADAPQQIGVFKFAMQSLTKEWQTLDQIHEITEAEMMGSISKESVKFQLMVGSNYDHCSFINDHGTFKFKK
jgi:hypothetical protein